MSECPNCERMHEALRSLLPPGWDDGTMDHMPGVAKARAALGAEPAESLISEGLELGRAYAKRAATVKGPRTEPAEETEPTYCPEVIDSVAGYMIPCDELMPCPKHAPEPEGG